MNSPQSRFGLEQLQFEIDQLSDSSDFADYLYNDMGPLFYAFAAEPLCAAMLEPA